MSNGLGFLGGPEKTLKMISEIYYAVLCLLRKRPLFEKMSAHSVALKTTILDHQVWLQVYVASNKA